MKKILFIALMGIIAMGFTFCGDNEEVKTFFIVMFDTGGTNACNFQIPVTSMCAHKGNGWYLPAINEL